MAEEAYHGAPEPATAGDPAVRDAWKQLGRDSPAGKALFKLYDGDFKGKAAGTAYHLKNKDRHDAKVATGWSPPPIEPRKPPPFERPTVNYPSFGRPKHVQAAPVHSVPRRKPASQIMAELEEERQAMRSHRPVPRGPLLDDREKERLAALMRYHGKVPELTDEERAAAQAARGKREPLSERQELQRMFDAVVAEVEERRQFLDDMQAAGKLTREMHHQLRTEIQERVDDMARLDQLISDAAR